MAGCGEVGEAGDQRGEKGEWKRTEERKEGKAKNCVEGDSVDLREGARRRTATKEGREGGLVAQLS